MASCTLFCDHNPTGPLRHIIERLLQVPQWGILDLVYVILNHGACLAHLFTNPIQTHIDQAGGGPAEKPEAGHYVTEGMAFQCHQIDAFQHPVGHVQILAILPLAPNGTEHLPSK